MNYVTSTSTDNQPDPGGNALLEPSLSPSGRELTEMAKRSGDRRVCRSQTATSGRFRKLVIKSLIEQGQIRFVRMKRLIPHRSARGPLPRNLGAFCGQIAPMVAILPVVPARKYCAIYYLARDHTMAWKRSRFSQLLISFEGMWLPSIKNFDPSRKPSDLIATRTLSFAKSCSHSSHWRGSPNIASMRCDRWGRGLIHVPSRPQKCDEVRGNRIPNAKTSSGRLAYSVTKCNLTCV